jgi:hypothetical protein
VTCHLQAFGSRLVMQVPTWLPGLLRKCHFWSLPEIAWLGGKQNSLGGRPKFCESMDFMRRAALNPFRCRLVGTCLSARMLGTGNFGNGVTRCPGPEEGALRKDPLSGPARNHFPWAPGQDSYPPGLVLMSVFPWPCFCRHNLPCVSNAIGELPLTYSNAIS